MVYIKKKLVLHELFILEVVNPACPTIVHVTVLTQRCRFQTQT